MAEMNSRMGRSRCVPPPALCLRIPALQACTDDLPLVLQRPDNFPLVMGILQEITQEKVGPSRGVESTERHRDQQVQILTMSNVKLESVDIEDHHQNLYNMNTDLYQEWSLKGVEELLIDPEELQLRHDCYRQDHEAAAPLEAPAPDEKPLFGLQSVHSQFGQKGYDQDQLLGDEKPLIHLQLANSNRERTSLQAKVLSIEADPEAKEGLNSSQAAVLANSNPQHVVQLPSQVHMEDRVGLGELQVVKREPEGPEGHGCCSEAQTQERQFLPDAYTLSDCAVSSEVLHGKVPLQSKETDTDTELNHYKKLALLGHKSHERKVLTSELQLQTGKKKRSTVHKDLRSTSAILALPAEFSEQEKNHPGKDHSQKSPSTLAAEDPTCPIVSSDKGTDSPQDSADFKVEDSKPQSVSSVPEPDCCELTLCLASSQPETANLGSHLADCHPLHEGRPVAKNFLGQEEHYGQCQRTNANQWQQTTKRCGSLEVSRNIGLHTIPSLNQKQLFPPTDWCISGSNRCCKDVERSTVIMETISKRFEHCGSSLDETVKTDVQYTLPLSNQGQLLSATGNCMKVSSCITVSSSRLNGGRTLQLMPESVEDGGSLLEERDIQNSTSEDDQVAEPNPPTAMESSNDNSQAEQASELKEPHKKRMRGTLPMEEKGDGVEKEKDTRCHRSDGKSWRCVRECINGAYYCQYHLRARRIGYNRRKNRDVSTDHTVSLTKHSSKSKRNSR